MASTVQQATFTEVPGTPKNNVQSNVIHATDYCLYHCIIDHGAPIVVDHGHGCAEKNIQIQCANVFRNYHHLRGELQVNKNKDLYDIRLQKDSPTSGA